MSWCLFVFNIRQNGWADMEPNFCMATLMTPEPVLSKDSSRVIHVLWGTLVWPLIDVFRINYYLSDKNFACDNHLAAKLSSPKVLELHNHCLNIIIESGPREGF